MFPQSLSPWLNERTLRDQSNLALNSSSTYAFAITMKRLLINLDDFGMCPSINAAIHHLLSQGIIQSASLMAVGVYFEEAVRMLKDLSLKQIGVHLSLTSEYIKLPTAPLTGLPSLQNRNGFFPQECPTRKDNLGLSEIQKELEAQIERVINEGFRISRLDGHMFFYEEATYGNQDLLRIVSSLAAKLGVRYRNTPLSTTYFIWDGYSDTHSRHLYYRELLKNEPFDMAELILHPAVGLNGLESFTTEGERRVADYSFFSSLDFRSLVRAKEIEVTP